MATAVIDVHHCHMVNSRGNSYRLKNYAELYNVRHASASAAAAKQLARREADAA